jgi:hypothetical protein
LIEAPEVGAITNSGASVFALVAAVATLNYCSPSPDPLAVEVDPKAREIVLRTAPVEVPVAKGPGGYRDAHHSGPLTPLTPFSWPVNGWARGFRLRVVDCAGNEVSRAGLHHAVVLHLGRRELAHPIYARLVAFGQETEDVVLPKGVGIRMAKGDSLGLYAAWMPSSAGAGRVMLELRVPYLPPNINPQPVEVLPAGFDVRYEPGEGASFDLPPGRSTRERVFELPIGGRLLLAGGHAHDYATSMALVDERSGTSVVEITPKLDREGRLLEIPRHLYGVTGRGVKLEAGRRYRMVVRYDNPTGAVLPGAGMGIVVGLLAPDDPRRWPVLDRSSSGFERDIEMLRRSGFLSGKGRAP